jgi:hypothetical protein
MLLLKTSRRINGAPPVEGSSMHNNLGRDMSALSTGQHLLLAAAESVPATYLRRLARIGKRWNTFSISALVSARPPCR